MLALLLLTAMAVPRAAAQECATPISAAVLALDLGRMERAYDGMDPALVRSVATDLGTYLPCIAEPLDRALAARLHRALGLRAWLDRSAPGTLPARLYFAAARDAEPTYEFPPELVGPDDPELREYLAYAIGAGRRVEVTVPPGWEFRVDGYPGTERPLDWPTVVQWLDGDGRLVLTRYVLPGDGTPAPPGAPLAPRPPAPKPVSPAPSAPAPAPKPIARGPVHEPPPWLLVGVAAGVWQYEWSQEQSSSGEYVLPGDEEQEALTPGVSVTAGLYAPNVRWLGWNLEATFGSMQVLRGNFCGQAGKSCANTVAYTWVDSRLLVSPRAPIRLGPSTFLSVGGHLGVGVDTPLLVDEDAQVVHAVIAPLLVGGELGVLAHGARFRVRYLRELATGAVTWGDRVDVDLAWRLTGPLYLSFGGDFAKRAGTVVSGARHEESRYGGVIGLDLGW